MSAGALQAWRAHPVLGPRFEELATTLRRAPPAMPRQLARSLLAVADCEADDARRGSSADDEAAAAALGRLRDAPMPLQATMLLCMGPDGYLSAAAQSALLESYAGALAAASARALADDARATHSAADQARRSTGTSTGPPPARAMRPLYPPAKRGRRGRCACLPTARRGTGHPYSRLGRCCRDSLGHASCSRSGSGVSMPRAHIATRTALHATGCSDGFGYCAEPHTRLRQQAVHSGHCSQLARVEIVPPCSPHAPRTYNSTRGPGPSGIARARSNIPTG